jgi:outer membrane biosynthesis protein TonB
VPCIERPAIARAPRRLAVPTLAAMLAVVAGCTGSSDRGPGEVTKPVPATATAAKPPPLETVKPSPEVAREASKLPPPRAVRSMEEVRRQAAERMVAANPTLTYTGKVPDQLLSISVVEFELNADGSIRKVEVLRPPRFAKETLQVAVDAARRAAPFGDVSKVPKPWKFVETFLFNEQYKFKPRTLDN